MNVEMRRLRWMIGFGLFSFAFAWVASAVGSSIGEPFSLPGWMIVPYWGLSLIGGTYMGGRWAIQTEPFLSEASPKEGQ